MFMGDELNCNIILIKPAGKTEWEKLTGIKKFHEV